MLRILKKILPLEFFEEKGSLEETEIFRQQVLNEVIPLITCSEPIEKTPGTLSFYALSGYRPNSFKFFFEMLTRWLIPGKRLNVVLVYATDFKLSKQTQEIYTICEVMLVIGSLDEFEEIQKQFSYIGADIALGIDSEFYAQRILEVKGLSHNEKTALIQSCIASLVKRYPKTFDQDILVDMQHVLVTCRDEFKRKRKPNHLSRIISIQYLFRRSIRELVKQNPERRYLNLKIFRAFIGHPGEKHPVLGILIGINFLKEQEQLGEAHILKAIQQYIPMAEVVDQSFLINQLGSEGIAVLYLEIEKANGEPFTIREIKKIRQKLPADLKNRVEQKLHPIFMPRNEEEVMRNMVILSNQLRYARDIPQVFISFDEQSHAHLIFTLILARVLKDSSRPIKTIFQESDTFLEYLHDRTKNMGYIRKKYIKEASVFRLRLPKKDFLRADHSIDLYKARQFLVSELFRILGEIRDYNGGMISKQKELLSEISHLMADTPEYDELLLENFFYSLSPVVAQTFIDPLIFKKLFSMLIEGLKEYRHETSYFKHCEESERIYVMILFEEYEIREQLQHALNELHFSPTELVGSRVKVNGVTCLAYLCTSHNRQKRTAFLDAIRSLLNELTLVG